MKSWQSFRIPMLIGAVLLPAGLLWSTAGMSAQDQAMSHDNGAMSQDSEMSHHQSKVNDSGIAADPGDAGTQDEPVYQNRVGHDDDAGSHTDMSRDKPTSNDSHMSDDADIPADPGNSGSQAGEIYQDPVGGNDDMKSSADTAPNMGTAADHSSMSGTQGMTKKRDNAADPGTTGSQDGTAYQDKFGQGADTKPGDDMSQDNGMNKDAM